MCFLVYAKDHPRRSMQGRLTRSKIREYNKAYQKGNVKQIRSSLFFLFTAVPFSMVLINISNFKLLFKKKRFIKDKRFRFNVRKLINDFGIDEYRRIRIHFATKKTIMEYITFPTELFE